MTAQFFDRQDTANPLNGTTVRNAADLRELMGRLRDRSPFFAELIGDSGFKVLLGIGPVHACVQYGSTDGSAPYWIARAENESVATLEGSVEFLIGDTVTPVPSRYRLPYMTMAEIAAHFVDTAERYPGVAWEEL